MAFARLLVGANEFIANETNTYQQHLRTIQSTNDSSEDVLWEDYLPAHECDQQTGSEKAEIKRICVNDDTVDMHVI